MGFLSNPDEDRILSTSEYQTKLAMALANGIQAAIK
jgi:N-acetylmuramoyl-L-alanine amidase